MNTPQDTHALFHVHRITGERRRYPVSAFPPMPKEQAEKEALHSRKVTALAGPCADEWETQAHPDE